MADWFQQVQQQGYTLLPDVFAADEVEQFQLQAARAFETDEAAIRQRSGSVYAARNVLTLWPESRQLRNHPRLRPLLQELLGSKAGLVRGLYFDKPPEQSWALPWHQDKLIAVQPDSVDTSLYSAPRLRLGVPHTEPPAEVLEAMITVRIHLDDMTAENGPLEVLPGSHLNGKELKLQPFRPDKLQCRAGDVLLMRPLLGHASGKSQEGTTQHRRILHLEFAASKELPASARWWHFYPINNTSEY
ncbi:phytanoyl-CoA dioxygenase family protein [Rubinisphaera sp. JC750]|uniref:phytanoyl-CoA dioxygenase family protein n=1 Tax=Rubinisphaera sp. JC750 TaxID=2898658 RepID=UPI001F1D1322|nr:phytanoyl-CoA dioxygenase family protein [Rubinisphaera sp. JC750]